MFFHLLNFKSLTIIVQVQGVTTIDKIIIIVLLGLVVITLISLLRNRKINAELQKKNSLIQKQALEIAEKNTKLEEKNKSLRFLNEEKNTLISVVSHDLKAPLNRIFALANLLYLSSDNLREEQKDYLEKMNQVVRDGLDLIRNLLDIRAIEFKGIEMKFEEIDLKKILQQMVKSYKSATEQKKQSIQFVCTQSEPLIIESDRLYINRIIDNLLSNATKFSNTGGEIRVELSREDQGVVIRIIDSGPGIRKEERENLFKKYQVLSARPTAGESSTGLGLSITKSLVEMLDGSINYEDNPGGGSIFVVKLPVLTHA